MAFSVEDFKSKLTGRGGLNTTNLFFVRITPPPAFFTDSGDTSISSDLSFFCSSVNIPGMTLDSIDYYPNGFGRKETRPRAINFGQLNTIFLLDSNHTILAFFHKWMQHIINIDTSNGIQSVFNGRTPYELNYKSEYAAPQIEILFFSPGFEDKYYKAIYTECFPIEIGELQLSWEQNDTLASIPIAFTYKDVKMDGTQAGNVVDASNFGAGLFENLFNLGSTGLAISQLRRPTSVQDAINLYSSVRTISNSLL